MGLGWRERHSEASPWGGGSINSSLMLATVRAYGSQGRPATRTVFVNRASGVPCSRGAVPLSETSRRANACTLVLGFSAASQGSRFVFLVPLNC